MTNTPAENRTALSEQLASGLAPLVIDESVLQAAFAAHHLGDIEQAARGYLAVLEKNPDHFDAIHLLGVIEYQRGNLTAALPLLRRAMAIPGHQSAEVFF